MGKGGQNLTTKVSSALLNKAKVPEKKKFFESLTAWPIIIALSNGLTKRESGFW